MRRSARTLAALAVTLPAAVMPSGSLSRLAAATGVPCSWTVDVAGSSGSVLRAVDAISTNDAWAVGDRETADPSPYASDRSLVKHWDGASWSRVAVPPLKGSDALTGVDALRSNDVWAVGSRAVRDRSGPVQVYLHWNGRRWRHVPPPARDGGSVSDVAAVGRDDVWAVGSSNARGGNRIRVWHWNGSAWSRADAPPITGRLAAAHAVAGRLLAAGSEVVPTGTPGADLDAPLLLRWSGSSWRRVVIEDSPPQGDLHDVSGHWSIGHDAADSISPWAARRTGEGWASVPMSGVDDTANLAAVAEVNTDDAWVVGARPTHSGFSQGWVILRWDGAAWTVEPLPDGYEDVEGALRGLTRVPGTPTLFAVGDVTSVGGPRATVLRRC